MTFTENFAAIVTDILENHCVERNSKISMNETPTTEWIERTALGTFHPFATLDELRDALSEQRDRISQDFINGVRKLVVRQEDV